LLFDFFDATFFLLFFSSGTVLISRCEGSEGILSNFFCMLATIPSVEEEEEEAGDFLDDDDVVDDTVGFGVTAAIVGWAWREEEGGGKEDVGLEKFCGICGMLPSSLITTLPPCPTSMLFT
jgi:hypothetical protein